MRQPRHAPIVPPHARPRAIARSAPIHFFALESGSEWRLYRRELGATTHGGWSSRAGFLLAGATIVAGLKIVAALTWSLL